MTFNSEFVLSEKNLLALEEYLEKSTVFHNLWRPEEEIADLRKAVLIYRDYKRREAEQ